MKKFAVIIMAMLIALSSAACSSYDEAESEINSAVSIIEEQEEYKIALITNADGIDDSDCLNAWKGITTYGDSTAKNYKYYESADSSTASGIKAIKEAVDNGAEIIILPSADYKELAYTAQSQFEDTSFILIGAMPTAEASSTDADNLDSPEIKIEKNVHCIFFKEEQIGYLAGYCAASDGFKELAIIGNAQSESSLRYTYGFIQGADDGAADSKNRGIKVKYSLIEPSDEAFKNAADTLFKDGTEVIFSADENISKYAAEAAQNNGGHIITGGYDSKNYGEAQLTSITYAVNEAIELSLSAFYGNNGHWADNIAGKALRFGAENGCIAIAEDEKNWKFSNFDSSETEKIIQKIINGEVEISFDTENVPTTKKVVCTEIEF